MRDLQITPPSGPGFTGANLQMYFIWNGEPIDGFTLVPHVTSLECTSVWGENGVENRVRLFFDEFDTSALITYPMFEKFDVLVFGVRPEDGEAAYAYYTGLTIREAHTGHSGYQLSGGSYYDFDVESVIPWKTFGPAAAQAMFGDIISEQ